MFVDYTSLALLALTASAPVAADSVSSTNQTLLKDISAISRFWGQISPYHDNDESQFGVQWVGLPAGCQVEQVHTLQRHAQRFPTSAIEDGSLSMLFAEKLANYTKAHPSAAFTGPLAFLNTYEYRLGLSYLTNIGANTEFAAGTSFWNRYGRLLYNSSVAQVSYNASYLNGTARPKPVLRTTSQSRIWNSQINWALGFFGSSFQTTPDPTLQDFTNGDLFDVVVIPEGGTENNTLASYDSCFNDDISGIGDLGDVDTFVYLPRYLKPAQARLQQYAPSGFQFSLNDTYAFQIICAYENAYIGQSEFCTFFTEEEWDGFENSLEIQYYYDYAFGNPTGRAQGIGYLQELLARLQNQYITSSNSSVNSSITNNAQDFPLGRLFYADFTHDDIIVSTLTAMSLDYFREAPSLTQFPPNPNRHFYLSKLTPFGGNLITEVIGCASASPAPVATSSVQYTPGQNGYKSTNASYKFIRMRSNHGILPLNTIRGGACNGRIDGMCALPNFIRSQNNSYALSNYNYACFGNYTIANASNGNDYDGTIRMGQAGIFQNTQSPAS